MQRLLGHLLFKDEVLLPILGSTSISILGASRSTATHASAALGIFDSVCNDKGTFWPVLGLVAKYFLMLVLHCVVLRRKEVYLLQKLVHVIADH